MCPGYDCKLPRQSTGADDLKLMGTVAQSSECLSSNLDFFITGVPTICDFSILTNMVLLLHFQAIPYSFNTNHMDLCGNRVHSCERSLVRQMFSHSIIFILSHLKNQILSVKQFGDIIIGNEIMCQGNIC